VELRELRANVPLLFVMDSPHTDPELRDWLRWASESANTPVFVPTFGQGALIDCLPDYALPRPVLLELKRRYPGDQVRG
jgi:hypothetical protein